MTRDFKSEFPLKYVCSAWQLRKRGYSIYPEGTNCTTKLNKKYAIIPVSQPLGRGVIHTVNPLYGMVEHQSAGQIIDIDIARIYGVPMKTIRIFSDCARGRMTQDRDTDEEVFAYHLGYFFRDRIYNHRSSYNVPFMEGYSSLKYKNFVFDANGCSWFN